MLSSIFSAQYRRMHFVSHRFMPELILSRWYLVDRWGRRAILMSGAAVASVSKVARAECRLIMLQMAMALMATGWWMWIDVPQTPQAVVVCVIIFNAAFGYR